MPTTLFFRPALYLIVPVVGWFLALLPKPQIVAASDPFSKTGSLAVAQATVFGLTIFAVLPFLRRAYYFAGPVLSLTVYLGLLIVLLIFSKDRRRFLISFLTLSFLILGSGYSWLLAHFCLVFLSLSALLPELARQEDHECRS